MSKHCDVCNKSYPETEPHCPHCAAAKAEPAVVELADEPRPPADGEPVVVELADGPRLAESAADALEGAAPAVASDSAVDLGEPVVAELASDVALVSPAPESGSSNVGWASLVEDVPADAGAPPAAKIDSPSDREIIGHAAPDTPPPPPEEPFVAEVESGVDLAGERPSAVNLGAAPAGAPEGGAVPEEETSAIDLGALAASGAGGSSSAVGVEAVGSSDVNLESAPVITPESGLSPAPKSPPSGAAEDAGGAEFPDDVAEVEAGSAVNLGEATAPTERPSSRDLIAEAVESGVDLAGAGGPAAGATEEGAVPAKGGEPQGGDSAVDLGGVFVAEVPSSGPEAVRERQAESPSGRDAGAAADVFEGAEAEPPAPGSSGVDLGGPSARRGKRPAGEPSSDVDLGDAAERPAVDEEPAGDEEAAAQAVEDEDDEAVALGGPAKRAADEAEEEAEEGAKPAKAKGRADDDEEDEDKPAPKPPKARSGGGCLVLGGALGLLVGVGAAFGLWLFGVEPPADWKLAGAKPPTQNPRPGPGAQPARPTIEDAVAQANGGDFDKALPVMDADANPSADVLVERGAARWLKYLQKQHAANARILPEDDLVKQARADLEKATQAGNNPRAFIYLAHLYESLNDHHKAQETYKAGQAKFQADPVWGPIFRDAVEASAPEKPAPRADLGGPGDPEAALQSLAVLLVAFQAGQPVPPADGAGNADAAEAGFAFWKAYKLAGAGNYAEAQKALEKAVQTHDKMRFTRLRKAQNPLSDPTEEIFGRACGEISTSWRMKDYLGGQKLLAQGGDPVKAVETLVKEKNDVAKKAMTLETDLTAVKKEKDDATKMVTKLETDLTAAKKEADGAKKEAKDLGEKLALADNQLKAAEGKLKAVGDRLEAAGVKGADLAKGVDQLAAADKALVAVTAKIADAGVKVDKKDVVDGVGRVVEMAKAKDPKGELAASKEEIKRLDAALAQRRTPQEMLDVWLPIVADRTQKEAAPKAVVDADRATSDPGAAAAIKGKALAVTGLARRNLGDFEAAGNLLHNSLVIAGQKGDWQPTVQKALKELTDPAAYYLPKAEELHENGKNKEALDVLAEAAKVFPKDNAALLPLRSLVRLDLAREKGKGKIDPADALVADAKKDAETAAAAGSAEGHYALGRIAEESGNLADAKASYAKALAAHADKDDAGSRYRLALARVLLKMQADKPAGGRAAAGRGVPPGDAVRHPLAALVLLVELNGQAEPGADVDEATKLADEVLAAKDGPNSFMLKAQALAVKGLWTKALQTYADGLKSHVRRDYADGLVDLINRHPALKRPDSLAVPNPLLAESHYATGLRRYFARRYADAEAAFLSAIEADSQDARYFYFLGLSRLALGKREDANADFDQGSRLELQNRPGREAVSTALERVQGTPRLTVNRFRP